MCCVILVCKVQNKNKNKKNKKCKGCFFVHRTKPADNLLLFGFQHFPANKNLHRPLLSQEPPPSPALRALGFCPIICSSTCDDLGRRWPARMNEGLWQSGMNSSSIFTTAEVVRDRRLPTGQLLSVKMALVIHELCSIRVRVGGRWGQQYGNSSHLDVRSLPRPGHPLPCNLSAESGLIWVEMKQYAP